MKHCENCGRDFDTEEKRCPVCGGALTEQTDDEVVTTMTVMGLL